MVKLRISARCVGASMPSKKVCKAGNPVFKLIKPSVHPCLALNF